MRDLPRDLWHGSYERRAYRRVMDGMPTERRGGAPFGIRRLRLDQPSKAVTGGARSEFVHPIENRFLTLRECARVQSFPDTFLFCGTASERVTLVGNAVPPILARVFAESMARDVSVSKPVAEDGCLISFVPTLSSGMSPALESVSRLIARNVPTAFAQLQLPA
jgi:DNA (cytosine-5)-methyltransferase 1